MGDPGRELGESKRERDGYQPESVRCEKGLNTARANKACSDTTITTTITSSSSHTSLILAAFLMLRYFDVGRLHACSVAVALL